MRLNLTQRGGTYQCCMYARRFYADVHTGGAWPFPMDAVRFWLIPTRRETLRQVYKLQEGGTKTGPLCPMIYWAARAIQYIYYLWDNVM